MPATRAQITIPMLPPTVNHYVSHKANGAHVKSPAAKAWERDFPLFSRGAYVVGNRFQIEITYTFGPHNRGDIDNFNKLVLDCCAKSGMMRNAKMAELSDAWIKRMVINIRDSAEDRKNGPETHIELEAIESENLQ